ncbi:MAG: phenylpyruvate tautomerase MIF-related protein [Gammaproteobacteria bacterium]|nr:phenylpyruvate tautomerase MIF-related protein [Gammaproteobacteria bacterium]
MPYLMIQTNQSIDEADGKNLLQKASSLVASELGKPESYVMVALEDSTPMLFAGDDAPLAYLELKSIGLPEAKTAQLSAALCQLMEDSIGVGKERVYIEFANAERTMWGWNAATF